MWTMGINQAYGTREDYAESGMKLGEKRRMG
jgi:hypothetical protein